MSSDSSGESDSSASESSHPEEDTVPLVRRNYENRQAAARIRNALRLRRPTNQSTELGELPDIEALEIRNTPLTPAIPSKKSSHQSDMSKSVTFSGKPSQLSACLTHVKVKLLADGTTDEEQKCGTLASHLRGPALDWLTRESEQENSVLLSDYGELVAQLKKAFAVPDEAQKLQAAQRLASLYQKGSVQEYAQRFEALATDAGLNDQTKTAYFQKGLKDHVKRGLIISDASDTYDNCVAEAIRIDTNLYYAGSHRKSGRRGVKHSGRGQPKRGKDGKFVKQEEF